MKRLIILLLIALLLLGTSAMADSDIKYALSMFHFNIQYVAGGLEGFVPFFGPLPGWEINAIAVEDMIVKESFEPILDMLMDHPTWAQTLELQGYFIDVLAERHPDVLAKLKTLADNDQVELVSFHYSDQLFLAFSYEDWRRSVELTQAVFADNDLPLSGTVFCQEGQAGQALAEAMETYGYETMVWPKNLWSYQHGDFNADPYYDFGNIKMVAGGKGVNDPINGVYVNWTFLGDGELLATGDWDPYFPWFFHYKPEAVDEYEEHLQDLVDDGYIIGRVGDYIAALENAGVPASEHPPLLDGTWQPGSTDGTSLWMGGRGLWAVGERDNYVRTTNAIAHRELLAAQTIHDQANLNKQTVLDEAWRLLALSQVTDASGINPFRGEIEYGIAHAAEALRISREIIEEGKTALSMDNVIIDTDTGSVTEGMLDDTAPPETVPPIDLEIVANGREVEQIWYEMSQDPPIYKGVLSFSKVNSGADRRIIVTFPGTDGPILLSPGLKESEVASFDRSIFVFEHFYMPLPNGLIGLGDDWFAIKDQAYVHLAAQIFTASPDVVFSDETAPWNDSDVYVFYLVQGQSDALDLANSLNTTPTLAR